MPGIPFLFCDKTKRHFAEGMIIMAKSRALLIVGFMAAAAVCLYAGCTPGAKADNAFLRALVGACQCKTDVVPASYCQMASDDCSGSTATACIRDKWHDGCQAEQGDGLAAGSGKWQLIASDCAGTWNKGSCAAVYDAHNVYIGCEKLAPDPWVGVCPNGVKVATAC
jgi:hypothetical protein